MAESRPDHSETVRGTFEYEATFEDVTRGWTDEEKQLLREGDDEAREEALSALLHLASVGHADELDATLTDVGGVTHG